MESVNVTVVQTKDANFERHPESFTPRIFVKAWDGNKLQYLELLQGGAAVTWPRLPYFNELKETYWQINVSQLSDLNIHHAKIDKPVNLEDLPQEVQFALEDAGMYVKDDEVLPAPVEAI